MIMCIFSINAWVASTPLLERCYISQEKFKLIIVLQTQIISSKIQILYSKKVWHYKSSIKDVCRPLVAGQGN